MNELALFAGAGGGILAGQMLGWRTVCAVERDAYAAAVLAQRQNDGHLDLFPIWSDVCSFDGKPWRGIVDIISGGFPCQDISAAGKGAGIDGERSGLWGEMARIICEVRPRHVFVENSPILTCRGLDRVLGDLAALGYDAQWGVLGASDVGAPHQRERIWIFANANSNHGEARGKQHGRRVERRASVITQGRDDVAHTEGITSRARLCQAGQISNGNQPCNCGCEIPNPDRQRCQKQHVATEPDQARQYPRSFAAQWGEAWWTTEPNVGRVANGVAFRVDRLKAIGNGQVPQCAAEAVRRLMERQ